MAQNQGAKQKTSSHSKLLIIGAGDAAICTLRYCINSPDIKYNQIRVIDPNTEYYYQSFQTMIGAGMIPARMIHFRKSRLIPSEVLRVYGKVTKVHPTENYVECDDGNEYSYDVLIIATGIELKTNAIKGLKKALEDPHCSVGSVYYFEYARKFARLKSEFKGGNAIFTAPITPIKCGGAPQKIMYLSCASWGRPFPFRSKAIKWKVQYFTGAKLFFPSTYYREALENLAKSKDIKITCDFDLFEIDKENRIAIFQKPGTQEWIRQPFDIMHVTPHQCAPLFLKDSGLANSDGFVFVDINTLQHKTYPNIFSIGDSASLPTSKTASTLNEQAHVLFQNVTSFLRNKALTEKYNGYTACPVFVGNGKLMLCEFGYNQSIEQTFFSDQRKPSYFAFIAKMVFIPFSYFVFGPRFIRASRHFIRNSRETIFGVHNKPSK